MWLPLLLRRQAEMNETVVCLHHAAQFVAMFGNSYVVHQPDDSQNNFHWSSSEKRMIGRTTPRSHAGLSLLVASFELVVEKTHTTKIRIAGQNRDEIIAVLSGEFDRIGLDPHNYQPISQFSLPPHPILESGRFSRPNLFCLEEWCRYLTNTQNILSEIAKYVQDVSEIRIWPHHFDMAALVILDRDRDHHPAATIGLGLAIADDMIPEPYFYINLWSRKPVQFSREKKLKSRGDWRPKGYNGMVLPVSRVAGNDDQKEVVDLFFIEGLNAMCQQAGKEPLGNKIATLTVASP